VVEIVVAVNAAVSPMLLLQRRLQRDLDPLH
jgi:hypothetical protein